MNTTPITLLDGGMGQELLRRGASGNDRMWSGWALVEDLETVRDIHQDYVDAGADVLTTNTYVTTRPRMATWEMENRFTELNETGARVAREVADGSDRTVRVAGSLPPQFTSYLVDIPIDEVALTELYSEQAEVLAPFCDLMLAETQSTVMECRAAAAGARAAGLPVWLSCSLLDHGSDRLRSGETIEQLLEGLADRMPDAILFNCTSPESVTRSIESIRSLTDIEVGGYANGFTQVPAGWLMTDDDSLPDARIDLDPAAYASHVETWLNSGATIVGGCCEIGPAHIAALRNLIDC